MMDSPRDVAEIYDLHFHDASIRNYMHPVSSMQESVSDGQ